MTKNHPTLISMRSAVEWRDAGMRYAYLKAGGIAAVATTLILCFGLGLLVIEKSTSNILLTLSLNVLAFVSLGAALLCARKMSFPHFPRMTLEELECMRNEMGIPASVYQRTHDRVLHGSFDEHNAIEITGNLLKNLGIRI